MATRRLRCSFEFQESKMNIIIIGATSGIGKALFEKYAVEGNRIGIVGHSQLLVQRQSFCVVADQLLSRRLLYPNPQKL